MAPKEILHPPSTLVIEYRSISLAIRGIGSVIIIVVILIVADVLSNILALTILGIWLVISVLWIKKAFIDTALIITNVGVKINSKQIIEWDHITKFLTKTIVIDGDEVERIMINAGNKHFQFDMEDLEVDKERLIRWIAFFKQRRSNLTSQQ